MALVGSLRLRRQSGLPAGQVLQSDTGVGTPGRPMYSRTYGLAGTPDYIVRAGRDVVPVEVKPGRTEGEPRESHMLQLLAYCLLLEETRGKAPPYGLLRYSNDTFKIDYNRQTRAYLLEALDEMRRVETQPEVDRNHDNPSRCRACAYHSICEQSLWP